MRKQGRKLRARLLAAACCSLALWLAVVLTGAVAAATEGSVAGVVTDDAGKPLRGAAITAKIDNMSVSRYTDASGKYLIAGLKPGSYKISATAYAFGSKTVDKEISSSAVEVAFRLKPNWNPTQISTGRFDEAAIRADLRRTLDATGRHGCRTEIIMKDVHTLHDEPDRLARWVELARQEIDRCLQ